MPLELVAVAPRQPVVREYEIAPPGPGEVLIRTRLAAGLVVRVAVAGDRNPGGTLVTEDAQQVLAGSDHQ